MVFTSFHYTTASNLIAGPSEQHSCSGLRFFATSQLASSDSRRRKPISISEYRHY